MPSPTPFIANGTTELQKNTELALYLLRYLEHRRDPHERVWRGERSLRTLQYTCHVLEALHDLGLKGLTQHLTEPAANWLLALPLDVPEEDQRAHRLFPSRFKTLAQINKFDAARLMTDFTALSGLFDAASGWIHDAPVDLHPTLVTMIWLDTLLHLEAHGLLPAELKARREQALPSIETAFSRWLDQAQAAALGSHNGAGLRPGDLANAGDASYAFDILCRAGRLAPDSATGDAARRVFTAIVREPRGNGMRRTDFIYCGVHLQQRFPQQAETREVVQAYLADLRNRYESEDCQREPIAFHALALRLLMAHHGEMLRTALLEKLWKDSLAVAEARERQEQEQIEAEFVNLVRQSIRVHLTPPQRITGTRARGEVYRVRFGLTTESTDEHGAPLSTPRDTLRLIVKKGPPEALVRASRRYRNLPEPLQRLFARHADIPAAPAPGYLIMQDLADMLPLSEVLAQLDRPVVLAEERQRAITEVAESVAQTLQTLHGYERRPFVVGHQLDIVYLAPIAEALERLVQPGAFPELSGWLQGQLVVNRRKHRPFDWYFKQLRRYADRLSPPSVGYVHGDCHSRNLMLSRDFATTKFVDIETLSSAEDYLLDYGLLLEDVAVYQSLPYGTERGRIEWDEIETKPTAGGIRLSYPAFPRSEAVVSFQTDLLRHLRQYADEIGDRDWQPRLWLAITRGLLLLASRQLVSHAVEPHRRLRGPRYVNDIKLVQVACAEALRLLRELMDYLSPRKAGPLPNLPFPGEHRASQVGLAASADEAVLAALANALGEAAERRPVPEKPYLIDLITRPGQQLFVRVNREGPAPVLYLAGRPEQLNNPRGLAKPVGSEDAAVIAPGLGSRVRLDSQTALTDIIDLARQAHRLAEQAV